MKHFYLYVGDSYEAVNPSKQFIVASDYEWDKKNTMSNTGKVIARNEDCNWVLGHNSNSWTDFTRGYSINPCWLKVHKSYIKNMQEVLQDNGLEIETDLGVIIKFSGLYIKSTSEVSSIYRLGSTIQIPDGRSAKIVRLAIIEADENSSH